MSNPRSASNAWSLLKKKLMSGGEAAPPNPKKARAKKATKEDAGEDGEPTPKKSPRKRAAKEPEDGDASPKKKGRAAKPKPKPKQEPEEETCKLAQVRICSGQDTNETTADVKAEVDSAEEAQVNGEDVDAEGEAEEV